MGESSDTIDDLRTNLEYLRPRQQRCGVGAGERPHDKISDAEVVGVGIDPMHDQLATATTSAGYSALFQRPDGRVGVLWETEGDVPGCRGEGCSIAVSFL